ncbi:MAG TPA: hypothetical protein VNO43_12625 [Candidatus Eisenbacteria bacterium]|nr:hypothetical protein [Candidatus Eisenbacteria bacterium]
MKVTRLIELDDIKELNYMACVVCDGRMDWSDFERQEAIALTGDIEDVILHRRHLEIDGQKTPDFDEIVKKVAFEYARRQRLLIQ